MNRLAPLAVAAALAACATGKDAGRSIEKKLVVKAPLADVWRAWSTTVGVQEWLAPRANVEAEIGGPYELFLFAGQGPQDHKVRPEVIGMKPLQMISFQRVAPPDMPEVRERKTWAIVTLERVDRDGFGEGGEAPVEVTIKHFGFMDGPEWDRALRFYDKEWDEELARLKRRFEKGPIDWGTVK